MIKLDGVTGEMFYVVNVALCCIFIWIVKLKDHFNDSSRHFGNCSLKVDVLLYMDFCHINKFYQYLVDDLLN